MSGYEQVRVRRFLTERGHVRNDGRATRLNNQQLPESYRNTIANWHAQGLERIPLGRWDEILLGVDLMLWEYEAWEEQTYGSCTFAEDVLQSELPNQQGATHGS